MAAAAYIVTIIGIPFGVALFKLAIVGLFLLGKRWSTATPRGPTSGGR